MIIETLIVILFALGGIDWGEFTPDADRYLELIDPMHVGPTISTGRRILPRQFS